MAQPSKNEVVDVVVVGAGAAGIACARKLNDTQGLNVLVLEATRHVGGRVRGIRESDLGKLPQSHKGGGFVEIHRPETSSDDSRIMGKGEYLFETGAEFIHGEKTVLFDLAKEYRAGARKLFTWAQGDGGPSQDPAPDGGIAYYWVGDRLLRYDDTDPEFVALNNTLWAMAEEQGGKKAIRSPNRYKESVRDYLQKAGISRRMMALAEAGYANTVAGSLSKISIGHTIDLEQHCIANDGEHDYRTRMSTIVKDMAKGLRVRTQAPVRMIRRLQQGDTMVEVVLRSGAVIQAKQVVVAVAVSSFQQGDIEYIPPLPAQKINAANSITMSPGCKILLKFSERFWPDDCHGIICSVCK